MEDHHDVIKLLVQSNAKINLENAYGLTAEQCARENHRIKIVDYLSEHESGRKRKSFLFKM